MLGSKSFGRVRTVGRVQGAGRSVVTRRTWYADEEQQDGKYKPATLEDAQKIIDSLVKRVDEHKSENQKLKGEISDYGKRLKAIEDGQQQQLQEQGNFKALAEKYSADLAALKPVAERAAALDAVIRQANEATIARIPEARRGLIPADYAPEKLQAWLANNGALLMQEAAPGFNAGESGDGKPPSKLTDAEKDAAKLMGVKPETIAALKERDANK